MILFYRFQKVCLQYRPNLPLVLKNVNMTIRTREKIGIVGRTGSGEKIYGSSNT